MKKLITFCFVVFFTALSFSQAPLKISYQAVIRDANGNLITNHDIGIRVSILLGSASGTEIYKEIYNPNPVTNSNGLVTLEIGGGIPLSNLFSNINWGNGTYYIKNEIDISGGTNYTISSTSQLLSVPFSLYAANSGSSLPGPQGPTGAIGPQGPIGLTGPQGTAGADGIPGSLGPQGSVCANGQNTLIKTTTEAAGSNCTTGGVKLEYGLDANNNGILDFGEINASYTKYVCNGNSGPTGQQGLPGSQGPIGLTGPQGTAGVDGIPGSLGPQGSVGANGQNTLIKTTTEAAGSNCITGGVKLEYGLDTNNNGILDFGEINASYTKYVCNGNTGPTGQQGLTGPQGQSGADGLIGPQGIPGPQCPGVILLNNSNYNNITIPSNSYVSITGTIILSDNINVLDLSSLNINGGTFTGNGAFVIDIGNNSIVNGVTFSDVDIDCNKVIFINCSFTGNCPRIGYDSKFYNCQFSNVTTGSIFLLGPIFNSTVTTCTLPRCDEFNNSKLTNCNIGYGSLNSRAINNIHGCNLSNSYIYALQSDFSFVNNRVNNTKIKIGDASGTSQSVIISNNKFSGLYTGENEVIEVDPSNSWYKILSIYNNQFLMQNTDSRSISVTSNDGNPYGYAVLSVYGNTFFKGLSAFYYNSNLKVYYSQNMTLSTSHPTSSGNLSVSGNFSY